MTRLACRPRTWVRAFRFQFSIFYFLFFIASWIPLSPPLWAAAPKAPDDGLAAAAEFLVRQQSADGSWKSDVYGTFKDGTALTPAAVVALQAADAAPAARRKGAAFLAAMVKADGTIDEGEFGLDYPAYTAALSVAALSHPENAKHARARDAWLKYLLDRQLTEALGWAAEDKPYGGWGYCRTQPRKPKPNELAPPLVESNLSATVFALEALKAAGHADAEVFGKARLFLMRTRNHLPPAGFDAKDPVRDGGFFFIYDDPVRNKAGGAPPRFHSYGSTDRRRGPRPGPVRRDRRATPSAGLPGTSARTGTPAYTSRPTNATATPSTTTTPPPPPRRCAGRRRGRCPTAATGPPS